MALPPGLGGGSCRERGAGSPGAPGEVTTCFRRLSVLPAGAAGPGGAASRGGPRLLKMTKSVAGPGMGAGVGASSGVGAMLGKDTTAAGAAGTYSSFKAAEA